ncbi:MAG: hypothetical protein QXT47_03605 [Desulfurococcaceae archaeon]
MENFEIFYLPLIQIEEEGNLKIVTGNEELGILLYIIKRGGRRRLFTRRAELIENLVIMHYPLIAVKFLNELILLFNPYGENEDVFEYFELDHEYVEKIINEATIARDEQFLYKLTELTNVFKDISEKKAFYRITRYRTLGLITNNEMINELKLMTPRYVEKRKYAVDLEFKKLDYEKYVASLENMITNLAREKAYLLNIKTKLRNLVENWINDLKEKYSSKLRTIDEELRIVRREVENKINEYERLKKESEDDIRGRYSTEIKQLDHKLKSLVDTRDNLKLELSKTKRIGGDTKFIKKKIKEVESAIKDLEKKKKELENSMKEELEDVRLRYEDLISREQARLKTLEDRKESLNRELENYIKQIEDKMKILEETIHELIVSYKELEKNVLDKGIEFKIENIAVIYVPICIVTYSTNGKKRLHYFTPMKIKKKFRGFNVEFFSETRKFLIDSIAKMYDIMDMMKIFNENNIMKKLTISEIEVVLTTLVNLGLVNKKNINKTIQSYRNQLFSEKLQM